MRTPMFVALLAAAVLAVIGFTVAPLSNVHAADQRVFELRIYTTLPGKLADLNKRFREHTNKLFVKHGMQLVGYWTPAEGPESENTLIYILAYPSREAREASWKAFQEDPDWKAARAKSEENGKIVDKVESKFLNPTDYSPIK